MANSRVYRVEPNVWLPSTGNATAQSPADRQASAWTSILAAVNQQPGGYEILDTTATTLDNTVYESQLNVSGTMAFTLADGTFKGQRKRVRCVGAASSPVATLTVTTPETASGFACAAAFVFDTVGQELEFVWSENSKWRCTAKKRAGGTANNVVVGTTVLTGYSMWQNYFLSVTATVTSSTTKGIPNGSVPGERCVITNSTAASSPIGDITGTFLDGLGTARTDIGAIGAVPTTTAIGDMAILEWTGTAWLIVFMNGVTLS